jgi:hypothetical protein
MSAPHQPGKLEPGSGLVESIPPPLNAPFTLAMRHPLANFFEKPGKQDEETFLVVGPAADSYHHLLWMK